VISPNSELDATQLDATVRIHGYAIPPVDRHLHHVKQRVVFGYLIIAGVMLGACTLPAGTASLPACSLPSAPNANASRRFGCDDIPSHRLTLLVIVLLVIAVVVLCLILRSRRRSHKSDENSAARHVDGDPADPRRTVGH
jgi:hypothetical protein